VIEKSIAGRPVLDEESFTKLLAAAYLMQEHQDRNRPRAPASDLTQIIPQVVETRRLIQKQKLNRDAALSFIANRLQHICSATGAAIGLLEDNTVRYLGTAGSAGILQGAAVKLESSLAWHCFNTGENLRSPAAPSDPRLEAPQCRKLGAQSLIAVPIYFEGAIGGAIELYFAAANAFQDVDIRVCELMAGIVTEVLAQAAEQDLKQAIANERATVLQALERLKPQLQKLADATTSTQPEPSAASPPPVEAEYKRELCRACGHAFAGNESECTTCGASRISGQYPGTGLQSKWATLWERQMAGPDGRSDALPVFRRQIPQDEEIEALVPAPSDIRITEIPDGIPLEAAEEEPPVLEMDTELAILSDAVAESSGGFSWIPKKLLPPGAAPKSWTEALLGVATQHGGDISLALAAFALIAALSWVIFSKPAPATADTGGSAVHAQVRRRHLPRQPKLTLFERTLVALGLAEPPPPVPYRGEPNVQVWVDLNTGLYYCPGANLYGATSKGKYTSQEDAQIDAFEPAYRKPCE
jgi:GAF domain-containing protein